MEDSSACSDGREQLGLRFTIDYLLYNKGHKSEREEPEESCSTAGVSQSRVDGLKETLPEEQNGRLVEQMNGENIWDEENEHTRFEELNEALPKEQDGRLAEQENEKYSSDENKEQSKHEKAKVASTTESQEQKPTESYIALISMAILASEEKKLLLSDIYQWIMDHYPYFKSKDKNWRNSVRHNLSLNECFIKAGRSDNGKGHFWAIHPVNYYDFSNGDYHRRQARRRVRRAMGRLPYTLPTSYSPFGHTKGTPCWCCPYPQSLPCLPSRAYWRWTAFQPHGSPSINSLV